MSHLQPALSPSSFREARALKVWLGSVRAWVALCLAWAAIIAFSHRNQMDPDGFSYLQMAARAANGDFPALVNSHWSPGYPALLGVLLAVFRTAAPENAFAVAHFLNYLIFIAATGSFVYFLRGWRGLIRENDSLVVPVGFVLFLKFGVDWLGVHNCTPDLAVGAVVLAAAGILCRLAQEGPPWILMPLLGFVLGIGYYVKAPLLPLSLFLFVLLFLIPPGPRVSRGSVLLAAAAFAIIAAPLVLLQSHRAGHLSFGESGKLAYAWYVNGIHGVHQGEPLDSRVHFLHPPRHLTESPVTLEFATPVQATYPLWFDPYYWAEGSQGKFNLKQQIAALRVALMIYAEMAMGIAVLIAGTILLLATGSGRMWPLGWRSIWVIAWPVSAISLYSLVHTESRFIAGFMIVLWMGLLTTALQRTRIVSTGAIVALMSITLLVPTTFRLILAAGRAVSSLLNPGPTGDSEAARALRTLGLREGDGIAIVGGSFEPYYAWIARVRVVAQTPNQDEVWRLSPSDFRDWLKAVSSSGAKALVTMDRPSYANQIAWQDLPVSSEFSSTIVGAGAHRYSVFLLPRVP